MELYAILTDPDGTRRIRAASQTVADALATRAEEGDKPSRRESSTESTEQCQSDATRSTT